MSDDVIEHVSTGRPLGISLAVAARIVDGALAHARDTAMPPMTVSVLDCAGRLVAMKREDGSSLLRPEIAHAKAWGALAMGMGSRGLAERAAGFQAFITSMTALADGNLVPVPGGVLLRGDGGELLGAVGVSGANPDQDEACGLQGIKAVGLSGQTGSSH